MTYLKCTALYSEFLRKNRRLKRKLIDHWNNLIFKEKPNNLHKKASKIEKFLYNCQRYLSKAIRKHEK